MWHYYFYLERLQAYTCWNENYFGLKSNNQFKFLFWLPCDHQTSHLHKKSNDFFYFGLQMKFIAVVHKTSGRRAHICKQWRFPFKKINEKQLNRNSIWKKVSRWSMIPNQIVWFLFTAIHWVCSFIYLHRSLGRGCCCCRRFSLSMEAK